MIIKVSGKGVVFLEIENVLIQAIRRGRGTTPFISVSDTVNATKLVLIVRSSFTTRKVSVLSEMNVPKRKKANSLKLFYANK